MGLPMKQEHLDFFLVPTGLLLMFGYHLIHLHRCLNFSGSTVVGYENHNKKAWVRKMLEVETKDRGQAITVINGNASAATSLASISLALSSLIGAWIGSAANNVFISSNIYGNKSSTVAYIKYMALLSCFLVAFACFVQATRCFVNANFLLSMPNCYVPPNHVENAVIRASNYWVVGVRSLYFATNLLLWIFGPIPMFICSVITVVILHYLDRNTTPLPEFKSLHGQHSSQNNGKEMTSITGANDAAEAEHQAPTRDNALCEETQDRKLCNKNERG